AVADDAGVVDEDVDPAEPLGDLVDHAVDLGARGDVGGDGDAGAAVGAELVGQAPGGIGVEVVDDDRRAVAGELPADGAADATGGPGDDSDAVDERVHEDPTSGIGSEWAGVLRLAAGRVAGG